MKKIISVFLLMLITALGFSQDKTVTFDYINNDFNGNQPLPSGERFVIKGAINSDIAVVTMDVFRNHRRIDTLYTTQWRRPVGNADSYFMMPVDFKFHGNKEYDVVFHFYRKVEKQDRKALLGAIADNLSNYLNSVVEVNSRRISLRSRAKSTVQDMNQIVKSAFTYYKNTLPGNFEGFSDIIESKVKQLNNLNITNARYNVTHDSGVQESQVRQKYGAQQKKELLKAAMNEVAPFVNNHLAVLEDVRERTNYPTEEISRTLSLNVGYGGVYLSGKWNDMDYDAAPYVGISFPLGNESISPFWGKTSISLGVFLKNFKDQDGNKITGPIVGLPYYLGLGYKFLHVFRFQAGAVATSTKKFDNIQNITTKDVNIKPFVGVSAEINLWMGFDNRK